MINLIKNEFENRNRLMTCESEVMNIHNNLYFIENNIYSFDKDSNLIIATAKEIKSKLFYPKSRLAKLESEIDDLNTIIFKRKIFKLRKYIKNILYANIKTIEAMF